MICSALGTGCGGGGASHPHDVLQHRPVASDSFTRTGPAGTLELDVATQLGVSATSPAASNTVATVAGRGIPRSEFDHWLTVAERSASGTSSASPSGHAAQLQQTMSYLLSAAWVEQEARWLGVGLSRPEVQAQLENDRRKQFKTDAQWRAFLSSSGQSAADVELRVKVKLLSERIQRKVVGQAGSRPTPQEVQTYLADHSPGPQRRDLLVVLTETAAAAQLAKSEIQAGKSFASVAAKRSIDTASKSKGGELPGVVQGSQPKPLDEAIFKAGVGVLSGPVPTPFGYYVFEVKRIVASARRTPGATESLIERKLQADKQQAALSRFMAQFQARLKPATRCAAGFIVQDCSNFVTPSQPASGVGSSPEG